MKLIHLSDLHLGKSKNTARFTTIVDWIIGNKEQHNATVVIITGDIVDDGMEQDFKDARTEVQRLEKEGFTVLSAPGNHDYGAMGLVENEECAELFQEYLGGHVKYPHVTEVDGYSLIILDSMYQEMKEKRFWGAQGKLGKKQLKRLDKILDEIKEEKPNNKIVVALHHHPFFMHHFKKLRDDKEFKKVLSGKEHARIDALLFGHKHVAMRFDDGFDKETKYKIDMIYASGSSTERDDKGKLIISILDLDTNSIEEVAID